MTPLNIWHKLTGNPAGFSMENRVFNSVSIITMLLLIVLLPFNFIIQLYSLGIVIFVLLILQFIFYCFARFKRMFTIGIIAYAVCSYLTLVYTFFVNSGSRGPILMLFFITFILLTTLTRRKINWIWIVLHLSVATVLLLIEYRHPAWIPNTYLSPRDRYIDLLSSYMIGILFIFFITGYLRRLYLNEKNVAEKRALDNQMQNEQITAQKIELEKLNEEKDKLFSIISHDLRSPLNSIIGYLELISAEHLDETEKKEMRALLLDTTHNTSDMVFNLLSWSKTQLKGVNTKMETLNLNDHINMAAATQNSLAVNKGIGIIISLDNAVKVLADKEMFQLVIRNLISNAVKYSPPGRQVNITASAKGQEVTICIKDQGAGIPSHLQSEIFSLQIRSTQGTNNEKGVGLGLILCKEFIERQNGKIWFTSVPGEGTKFCISLAAA